MSSSQVIYKLTDFGYAKQYDNSSVCTSLVGTVQYVVSNSIIILIITEMTVRQLIVTEMTVTQLIVAEL